MWTPERYKILVSRDHSAIDHIKGTGCMYVLYYLVALI